MCACDIHLLIRWLEIIKCCHSMGQSWHQGHLQQRQKPGLAGPLSIRAISALHMADTRATLHFEI